MSNPDDPATIARAAREAFAQDSVIRLAADADTAALGAAITVALCGHWEHEPPCPLAPHHTAADRRGGDVYLRTLFAADPLAEAEVRRRITAALRRGSLVTSEGESRWEFESSERGMIRDDEAAHAQRLIDSP